MVIGHGIDLVELQRVTRLLTSESSEWVDGVFTTLEQEQADPEPNRTQYYAGRYAAKETVAKALGTGFSDEVAWLDVEILRQDTGAPEVRLSGGALEAADALGVTRWLVSISHSGGFAVASALAVSD